MNSIADIIEAVKQHQVKDIEVMFYRSRRVVGLIEVDVQIITKYNKLWLGFFELRTCQYAECCKSINRLFK